MSTLIKAAEIEENGGPDKIIWKEFNLESLLPGQVTIEHKFVGLNFIDTYHRSGLYPLTLPSRLGMEASGVVVNKSSDVDNFEVGDRVAYVMALGSYSTHRNIESDKIVKIPDSISNEQAAAALLKGMTVEYLVERLFKVNNSHTVLLHAAAGGVGIIACQWLKTVGAKIIGTVGSEEKATLAKENGCDEVILYNNEDFVNRVKDITDNKGVDVVYDGVGKDTAIRGLDCLKPLGTMVVFGNSSGNCPPVDPNLLAAKGSLFLTRPTLMTYGTGRADLLHSSKRVFDMLSSNKIRMEINSSYNLSEVAKAHFELESRNTTGSIVMKNDY